MEVISAVCLDYSILFPFHSILLFQAKRPTQKIQTLNRKTENQYRENDKNTEDTKHTVKQPRQKMNVHAHLHNLKRLCQSITTSTPACRVGFPSIGCVALGAQRPIGLDSDQTLPWTMCRSVGASVRTCVRPSVCPVHCGKRRIGSGCHLAS